tara:strand:+ start:43214 stop:44245 length:1032 start_codon:yes stop_codon:yes gene_type:complete
MTMVDGVPHGPATSWHPNGEIASQGHYERGKRHGSFTFWNDDRTWLRIDEYEHGALLWSSTESNAAPPSRVVTSDGLEEDLSVLWKAPGRPWPAAFPTLTHLTEAGVVAQVSSQALNASGTRVGSQHLYASAAHSLGKLGSPETRLYLAARVPRLLASPLQDPLTGRVTLEGGASYAVLTRLNVRLGLLVPVANDGLDGNIAATRVAQHRVHDRVATYPRSLGFRSSAAYSRDLAFLTLRVDPGLDVAVDAFGDEMLAMEDSIAIVGTLGFGVGVGTEYIGVSAQFDSAIPLVDSSSAESAAAFSLSTQVNTPYFSPAASVTLPLSGDEKAPVLMLGLSLLTE